jgi:hypothetical protein
MKQLTVLAANQPGQLAKITEILAHVGVNIEDFDVETNGADGLISLTVDKYDEAMRALRDAGYRTVTQDTLLIRLEDRPGALAVVAARLKDAGLDLRSMHIIRRTENVSIASLVANDNAKAAAVLKDVLIAAEGK